MKLKCPKCLYEYDPREATKDQAMLQVIMMQPEFAPHHKLVFEYAELFGATRPVKAAKLLRILTEVLDIWKAGQFVFQKRLYRISKEGMAQALKTVCNKNLVSLDNHNYLKKVMVTVAEEEAVRLEKALKEKEARIRSSAPHENPDDPDGWSLPVTMREAGARLPWKKD